MASKKELDKKLQKLQKLADEQNTAFISSNDKLYQTITDAYLWWREAMMQKASYLDGVYKKNNIKWNKPKTNAQSVQFTPLVKLAWGITDAVYKSQTQSKTNIAASVNGWSKAIAALDKEWVKNPQAFEKNPRANLINFIISRGGTGGLKRGFKEEPTEDVSEKTQNETKIRKTITEQLAGLRPKAVTDGKAHAQTAQKITAAAIKPKEPVLATEENLVAMLGRVNANGGIDIVYSSDDAGVVNTLAANSQNSDTSNAPPTVAALTEVVSTQILPQKISSKRKELQEKSNKKFEITTTDKKTKKVKTSKVLLDANHRVVVRPKQNDILYSRARTEVSVVTRFKPKEPFIKSGGDVFLQSRCLKLIEQAFVYKNYLNYVKAKPAKGVKKRDAEYKSKYRIDLSFPTIRKDTHLFFIESKKGDGAYQADVIAEKIKNKWTADLTSSWLKLLHIKFSSEWMKSQHGVQIKRNDAEIIKLVFTDNAVTAWFNKQEDRYSWDTQVKFTAGCKCTIPKGKKVELEFMSKDIIPVLSSLPNMQFSNSKVKLKGNDELITFSYKTAHGEYEIYVPTVNSDRKRNSNYFKEYKLV